MTERPEDLTSLSVEAIAERRAVIEAQIVAHEKDPALLAVLQQYLVDLTVLAEVTISAPEALAAAVADLASDTRAAVEGVDASLEAQEDPDHPFADGPDGLAKVDFRIPGARYVKHDFSAKLKIGEDVQDEEGLTAFIEIPENKDYLLINPDNGMVYRTSYDPRTTEPERLYFHGGGEDNPYEVREGVLCVKGQEEAPLTLRQLREANINPLNQALLDYQTQQHLKPSAEALRVATSPSGGSRLGEFILDVPAEDPATRENLAHSLAIQYLKNDIPERARRVWAETIRRESGGDSTAGEFGERIHEHLADFAPGGDLQVYLQSTVRPQVEENFASVTQNERLEGYGQLDVDLFVDIVIKACELAYTRAQNWEAQRIAARSRSATRSIAYQASTVPEKLETLPVHYLLGEILQAAGLTPMKELNHVNLQLPAPAYLTVEDLRFQADHLGLVNINVFDEHLEAIRTALAGNWVGLIKQKAEVAIDDSSFDYHAAVPATLNKLGSIGGIDETFTFSKKNQPDTPVLVMTDGEIKVDQWGNMGLEEAEPPAHGAVVVMHPNNGLSVLWSQTFREDFSLEGVEAGAGKWGDEKVRKLQKLVSDLSVNIGLPATLNSLDGLWPNDVNRDQNFNPFSTLGMALLNGPEEEDEKDKQRRLSELYLVAQKARIYEKETPGKRLEDYDRKSDLALTKISAALIDAPDPTVFVHQFIGSSVFGDFRRLDDISDFAHTVEDSTPLMTNLLALVNEPEKIPSAQERISLWKALSNSGSGIRQRIEELENKLGSNLGIGVENPSAQVLDRRKQNFPLYLRVMDWVLQTWEMQRDLQTESEGDLGMGSNMTIPGVLTATDEWSAGKKFTNLFAQLEALAAVDDRLDGSLLTTLKTRFETLKASV